MFRTRDTTDWMWAEALTLLDRAERMHRQFFRLAASPRTQAVWEPPVDVLENEREVVLVVALPGVAADRVTVSTEPGAIVVRAERALPFAGSRYALRQLEIPYGVFERRIGLPDGRFVAQSPELSHGCLILRLRRETNRE
jgi:HSP20 family molecular chaperone IbpA